MFTAENRKSLAPVDLAASPMTSPGGFGKVLSSVQGLQQRLNDFSFEEVSEIETNANSLIQGLSRLQIKLAWLVTLKLALLKSKELIDEAPETDYDLIGPDSLAKHPGLHAIVNADKLIRLHRALQIAKESAESISLTPRKSTPSLTANPVTKNRTEYGEIQPQHPTDLEFLSAPSSAQKTSETTDDHTETFDEGDKPLFNDLSTGEGSFAGVSDRPITPFAPAREKEIDSEKERPPIQEAQAPTVVQPATQRVLEEVTPKISFPIESSTNRAQSLKPPADAGRDSTKLKMPDASDFDQHLLDELIQNYGEFVISPEVTTSPEESFRPEPNFVAPTPPLAVERIVTEREPQRAAGILKHGEIDLQLKKIIKDYGEKDLYSHHKSTKLKKGGIIACILLGLLACGFYYFGTPAKTLKPADDSSSRSGVAADSADRAKIIGEGANGGLQK